MWPETMYFADDLWLNMVLPSDTKQPSVVSLRILLKTPKMTSKTLVPTAAIASYQESLGTCPIVVCISMHLTVLFEAQRCYLFIGTIKHSSLY